MKTLYYQKDTGIICERHPKNIEITDDCLTLDVEDDQYQETLTSTYGYVWAVKDGQLVNIEDTEITSTTEYKLTLKYIERNTFQRYLSDTDYVVSKLNELKLEDEEEYETEKANYTEVLAKRKEARKRINELKEEIASLEAQ